MRNTRRRVGTTLLAGGLLAFSITSFAAPGDPVHETCPESGDVGENVECYPVSFISKTEVHPDGIPIIGYLFVPTDRPDEPLPAIVFAHGSGSMYSSGNHNKGLNSKHKQWVKQYTSELGIVSLHVSSFHSRYLLPDTPGDQRVLEIDIPPTGTPGGDDYRATSTAGGLDDPDDDLSAIPGFDPEADDWKDQSNGRAGVSEIIERSYDMDAAWDFLSGIRAGTALDNARNEDDGEPTLGTPFAGTGYIGDIVSGGLRIDHERISLYGTSHGGQTAMAAAHAPRALADDSPMNIDLPDDFERRRFAAFFDYYGGCGLYGAYNGADFDPDDPDDNSTWRPYGPFLMLHGEFDGIWKEQETGTVREQWLNSECKPRIDAAKADPDFDEFLEVVIYEDAEHSFDGVERDDFESALDEEYDSWLAKIHANYRITVPFMEAIGRQVAAARNSETVPPLEHLGFPERLPDFDTFPLPSSLGPQPVIGGALDIGAGVTIDDLTNGQLDIETLLIDPFRFFDIFCAIDGAPVNVNANECVVDFSLTEDQLDSDLPTWFWIHVTTARGRTALPVRLALSGTQSGELTFGEPFYAISVWPVSSEHDGTIDLPVDGLVWSRFTSGNELHAELSVDAAGYSIENSRVLNGPVPGATPLTVNLRHYMSGNAVASQAMAFDAGDGTVGIQLIQFEADGLDEAAFDTPALPFADFNTNFVALTPVDDGPGGGDPGGGDPGGNDPGGNDPGGDDPGGDDPGGDDPGNDAPGDSDSGGGGAFLWLLPAALLLRRRNRTLPA